MTDVRTKPLASLDPVGEPVVVVLQSQVSFSAEPGETVYAAAERHDLCWPTACGGRGICGLCVMEVEEGRENLGPIGIEERELLTRLYGADGERPEVRLACRAKVLGDVTVRRRGVKPRSSRDGDKT